MKKVISALTAATMVASMSANVMSAFAVYTESDIAFTLKVNPNSYYLADADGNLTKTAQTSNFTVSEDGKTITFASAADAAGAKFGVGAYIVADVANPSVQQVGGLVESASKSVHIQKTGAKLTGAVTGDEATTYTAAAGDFSYDGFVNTFGSVKRSKYANNTGDMSYGHSGEFTWSYDGPEQFFWIWAYDFKNSKETASFLGAKSDDFPVTEFTVSLDSDIAAGTYTINYGESYEHATYGTTVSSFLNTGESKIVPSSMEGITIIVGGEEVPTETEAAPTETEAAPTETEAAPTETEAAPTDAPEVPTEKEIGDAFTWAIDDVIWEAYDAADADAYVEVPIKVYNDKGLYGAEFQILVNGKSLDDADCPLVLDDMTAESAYSKVKGLVPNLELGAGALSIDGEGDDFAAAGEAAILLTFIPKDGATFEPGTKFTLSFANYKLANYDKEIYSDVVMADGSITIPGGEDTTEPVTETEAVPTETEAQPTETEAVPTETEAVPTETEAVPTETEAAPTEPAPVGEYLYGDVNKNNTVELVDIVMLNRFLTKYDGQTLDAYQIEVANCAGNAAPGEGKSTEADLNGQDSVEILKYLIGLVASLPSQG